jgi:hypothetical protein
MSRLQRSQSPWQRRKRQEGSRTGELRLFFDRPPPRRRDLYANHAVGDDRVILSLGSIAPLQTRLTGVNSLASFHDATGPGSILDIQAARYSASLRRGSSPFPQLRQPGRRFRGAPILPTRWLQEMRAKKASGEIDRFPGGQKAGPGWGTPKMWEMHQIVTMQRRRAEREALEPTPPGRRRDRPTLNATVVRGGDPAHGQPLSHVRSRRTNV